MDLTASLIVERSQLNGEHAIRNSHSESEDKITQAARKEHEAGKTLMSLHAKLLTILNSQLDADFTQLNRACPVPFS